MNIKVLPQSIFAALILSLLIYSANKEEAKPFAAPQLRKSNPIKESIDSRKRNASFEQIRLFRFSNSGDAAGFTRSAVFLNLQRNAVREILRERKNDIVLEIPVSNEEVITLELTRVSVTTKGFRVKSMTGQIVNIPEENELYYRGIVKSRDESFASISINEFFVSGIIALEEGNLVLGPVGKESRTNNNYVLYNDADLLVKNNFKCGVDDDERFTLKRSAGRTLNQGNGSLMTQDTLRVYFEADYQMYLDNGSSEFQLVAFIRSMFAHVQTLYAMESVPIGISEIRYWYASDPYAQYNESDDILFAFGASTQDNFNGDLAELLSTRNNGNMGGIAWINVLCQSYYSGDQSGRFSFSNIQNNYSPWPVYSWTVHVVTHELGHNIASKHTHWCGWPVPNGPGAIDSCVQAEGPCFVFPQPNQNGTIMSYCHLNGGINFINGFGPLPGDTIRLGYSVAICIDTALNSSEVPRTFSLSQNYPNPFNPVTTIRFSIPEDGYVSLKIIDITGREVGTIVPNQFQSAGIYSYSLNSDAFKLATGVYFYKLDVKSVSGAYSEARKMMVLK
jgi:hypothetical protein